MTGIASEKTRWGCAPSCLPAFRGDTDLCLTGPILTGGGIDWRCLRILSGVPTDPLTVGAAEQSVALAWWSVSGATRIHPLLFSRSRSQRLQRVANRISRWGYLSNSFVRCHALRLTKTRCGALWLATILPHLLWQNLP